MSLKSDLYRNQPINPMEHAVYWGEYIIKHKGAKHIKSIAAKMPLYRYLLLDVIAFLSIASITLLTLTYYSIKFILKNLLRRKRKVKHQ